MVRSVERRASASDLDEEREPPSRLRLFHPVVLPAPSSERPVFSRNTSSRLGSSSLRFETLRPSRSRARTTSVRSPPAVSLTATAPGWAGISSRTAPGRGHRVALRASAGVASTLGRPISAFKLLGRVLGDDPAVVDDPDPVREHVGLFEVLGREEDRHAFLAGEPADLGPQRAAALGVEAGRRLVEKEYPRPVHEREREVEPPLHPAGVAAHPPVGGLGEPDALQELVSPARSYAERPCSAAWRRR